MMYVMCSRGGVKKKRKENKREFFLGLIYIPMPRNAKLKKKFSSGRSTPRPSIILGKIVDGPPGSLVNVDAWLL